MASQEPAVWLLWAVLGRVAPLVLEVLSCLGGSVIFGVQMGNGGMEGK